MVSVQRGTAEGIEEPARAQFLDADAAVAWARGQGDLVLVRTMDPIEGGERFSAGTEPHPWPDWPGA